MRRLALALAVIILGTLPVAAFAAGPPAHAPAPACARRILIVSAMPTEIGPFLSAATLDKGTPNMVDEHSFFFGTLAGKRVIMAMTGIGLVNATTTTELAFKQFRCGSVSAISAVIFSGVAGGGAPAEIGDVTVPSRWTEDNGATWHAVDPAMLATAKTVKVALQDSAPVGDRTCACNAGSKVTIVDLHRPPKVVVGGSGISADTFGGKALPCVPDGGDLFGCQPCLTSLTTAPDGERLASGVASLATPGFLIANLEPPPASPPYVATDEETAAVQKVAGQFHVPFLGFRAISDGAGDPLMLPGFPWQFFVYAELAAQNAATTAIGFLRASR